MGLCPRSAGASAARRTTSRESFRCDRDAASRTHSKLHQGPRTAGQASEDHAPKSTADTLESLLDGQAVRCQLPWSTAAHSVVGRAGRRASRRVRSSSPAACFPPFAGAWLGVARWNGCVRATRDLLFPSVHAVRAARCGPISRPRLEFQATRRRRARPRRPGRAGGLASPTAVTRDSLTGTGGQVPGAALRRWPARAGAGSKAGPRAAHGTKAGRLQAAWRRPCGWSAVGGTCREGAGWRWAAHETTARLGMPRLPRRRCHLGGGAAHGRCGSAWLRWRGTAPCSSYPPHAA